MHEDADDGVGAADEVLAVGTAQLVPGRAEEGEGREGRGRRGGGVLQPYACTDYFRASDGKSCFDRVSHVIAVALPTAWRTKRAKNIVERGAILMGTRNLSFVMNDDVLTLPCHSTYSVYSLPSRRNCVRRNDR